MNCDKCNSSAITYYKQQRSDGVWVVTARCKNGHHPIKGKPFYPISKFDIASLPVLGGENEQPNQFSLFAEVNPVKEPQESTETLVDFIERKRSLANKFAPIRKNQNDNHS